MTLLPGLTTALILGFRNRYVLALAIIVVLVIAAGVVMSRRGRGPRLQLRDLSAQDSQRYADDFVAIERVFVDRPEQAAARARGVVEEVMRRRGFPDRIEPGQRIKDLAGHDREAARSLEAANLDLAEAGGDTERLRRAVQGYRGVLQRLVGRTEAAA
jgi:hypothetical protein